MGIFSRQTLEKFEDASAGIPLRQLDRVFTGAHIRPGTDPGGAVGSRKAQFRRYIAGVNQRDPRQLDRLGAALGALIEEVAASKQEFLVKAAERDGFLFADGVFRPAQNLPANGSPADAVAEAQALVESVCRMVLRLIGEPAPGKATDFAAILTATVKALESLRLKEG